MKETYNPHTLMSAGSIQILASYARKLDLCPHQLLQDTKLNPSLQIDPESCIEAWQEVQMVRNIIKHTGNAFALGLNAGQHYHIASYGMWGLAMMSSATFKEAVQIGTQYLDVASHFNHVSLVIDAPYVHFTLDSSHLPDDVQAYFIARDLASVSVILKSLLPETSAPMQGIEVPFSDPGSGILESLFQCPVKWNQPLTKLTAPITLLAHPLHHANPITTKICQQQCLEQRNKMEARISTSGRVKHLLMQQLEQSPSMQQIAKDLNTTARTLRRQLESEGTSWRGLIDDVRMQIAERLLIETELSQQTIAERLGYTDPSSFSHAFKRMKNCAPDTFRRQYSTLKTALMA